MALLIYRYNKNILNQQAHYSRVWKLTKCKISFFNIAKELFYWMFQALLTLASAYKITEKADF